MFIRSAALISRLVVPAALAGLTFVAGGCTVSVNLDGEFLCEQEPRVCPDGLVCVGERCVVPQPGMPDANTPIGFERTLTIAGAPSPVGQALVVLVLLDPTRIDYTAAGTGGETIEFLASDGETLDHEVATWNPDGESHIWLRLASLDPDTEVRMRYGGSPPDDVATNPWASYPLVAHFEDNAANSGATGIGLEPAGGATFTAGRIGRGIALDGVDGSVELGTDLSIFDGQTQATVSAWVNASSTGGVIEFSNTAATTSRVLLNISSGAIPNVGVLTTDGTITERAEGPPITFDEWHWIVGTINLTSRVARTYVDGVRVAEIDLVAAAMNFPPTPSAIAAIGKNDTAPSGFLSGIVDEVRAEAVAIGPDEIAAQYQSMTDGLFVFGPEQPLF